MTAVFLGLVLIVLAFLFNRWSAHQHRVFSALMGAMLFAVVAFFLTAKWGTTVQLTATILSAVVGGALFAWLLVTGIFFGGVFFTFFLAYIFVFVIPLPIPTLYWGYATLILGICAVWKKHLAAQILESALTGILTAFGGGLLLGNTAFFELFSDPKTHHTENLIFVLASLLVAVGYGIYRVKTHRLEEVK
ncbi:MAG: hypothetical protein J6D04_01885 [Clostridia bacterium]|nr:hypothetical protein [Clostridia bacterium]